MAAKQKSLVIVGDGEFAEIAYEYFTHDSPYEVAAFAVERSFLKKDQLFGLPVVAFEEVERYFPPASHQAFVAVTYTQLNRVRARLCREARARGFTLATYVSSRAFVWHNVRLGDNCFVFENNVLQYCVEVGNGVVLWSGNHVGHRSVIRDSCFISSHVVISGYCDIGESCFLGVNSTLGDHVHVGRDCVIGAGAVIVKNTEPGKVYKGDREAGSRISSLALFKVKEEAAA
jgi:sugar O-acyltransferase (sialic acid O-acetyltransferase NeuD family)